LLNPWFATGPLPANTLFTPAPATTSWYWTTLRAYCWSVVPRVSANSRKKLDCAPGGRMIAQALVIVAVSGWLWAQSDHVDPFGSTTSRP